MAVSGKLGIAIRKITAILAINDKLFKITTFKFSEIHKKNLWRLHIQQFCNSQTLFFAKKKKQTSVKMVLFKGT